MVNLTLPGFGAKPERVLKRPKPVGTVTDTRYWVWNRRLSNSQCASVVITISQRDGARRLEYGSKRSRSNQRTFLVSTVTDFPVLGIGSGKTMGNYWKSRFGSTARRGKRRNYFDNTRSAWTPNKPNLFTRVYLLRDYFESRVYTSTARTISTNYAYKTYFRAATRAREQCCFRNG